MSHTLFPYQPPVRVAPRLWQVQGASTIPGLPRNMTIFQLPHGGLLLHSVVAMDDVGHAALEALGRPEVMVVPHAMHAMDAAYYKNRYPHLRVLTPDDAREGVTKRGAAVDGNLEQLEALGVQAHRLHAMKFQDFALEFPLPDGRALLFTDLLGNVPKAGGFRGALLNWMGNGGRFGVPRIVKFRQVGDKAAARAFLREAATWPDLRVILMSHGAALTTGIARALEQAAEAL